MSAERLRPLQQLPMSNLRVLFGVLTDIDDTLTRDGAIEPAALQALHDLARAQLPVVAITGRPAGWSEPFAMAWPVAAIVAENGAVMLRREGTALRCDFTQSEATRAENFRRLQACAEAVSAELPFAKRAQDSAGRLTDIAIDHSEFTHLDAGQIRAVLVVMRRHGLNATVSSIHVNGWIGVHDKWSAARWAVEQAVGVPFVAADWLYVGDSTNDQLMFEHIPVSVAVANIARFIPSLSVLPAYVTPSERGTGFAEVVARLLASRSSAPPAD
jgi:HAD superfamily hydrolase (TIGR01484 family)